MINQIPAANDNVSSISSFVSGLVLRGGVGASSFGDKHGNFDVLTYPQNCTDPMANFLTNVDPSEIKL